MEYIIFMATIQVPFLYLIWRLFHKGQAEQRQALKTLKKQTEHITRFMDTLKMSLERVSDDLYGRGKITSRFEDLESQILRFQSKLEDMEIYTGLNNSKAKEYSPSPVLKDKSFI